MNMYKKGCRTNPSITVTVGNRNSLHVAHIASGVFASVAFSTHWSKKRDDFISWGLQKEQHQLLKVSVRLVGSK